MTKNEEAVLAALADVHLDALCLSFDAISYHTNLERKAVRRAARALARKGFAKCRHGLWTEDGQPAGSGYGCTKAGYELHQQKVTP